MVDISLRDSESNVIKTEEMKGPELPCDYGCGSPAKHKISNGKVCCSKYPIQCKAVRYKKGIPDTNDHKVQVVCDCFHNFVVMKSEIPRVCPRCKRMGVYRTVKEYIEWK